VAVESVTSIDIVSRRGSFRPIHVQHVHRRLRLKESIRTVTDDRLCNTGVDGNRDRGKKPIIGAMDYPRIYRAPASAPW